MPPLQNPKARFNARLKLAKEADERANAQRKKILDRIKSGPPADPGLADSLKRVEAHLKEIESVVKILTEAIRSGILPIRNLSVAVKKEMKFIAGVLCKLSRGAKVTVLGFIGDWYQVKAPDDCTGWLHSAELMPALPVELSSAPGSGTGSGASRDEVEIGGRG